MLLMAHLEILPGPTQGHSCGPEPGLSLSPDRRLQQKRNRAGVWATDLGEASLDKSVVGTIDGGAHRWPRRHRWWLKRWPKRPQVSP